MDPEVYRDFRKYAEIHKGDVTREGGIRILSAVLLMIKMYAEDVGEEKAFDLFERWATLFCMSGTEYVKQRDSITETTPHAFYKAMGTWDQEIGDRWEIIEESPERIKHYIHDCIFRDACEKVGIDKERWGTCQKAIPQSCDPIASAVNPDLQWKPRGCSDKPGGCVFEVLYRDKK